MLNVHEIMTSPMSEKIVSAAEGDEIGPLVRRMLDGNIRTSPCWRTARRWG